MIIIIIIYIVHPKFKRLLLLPIISQMRLGTSLIPFHPINLPDLDVPVGPVLTKRTPIKSKTFYGVVSVIRWLIVHRFVKASIGAIIPRTARVEGEGRRDL